MFSYSGPCEYYISHKPTFWRASLSMLNFRLARVQSPFSPVGSNPADLEAELKRTEQGNKQCQERWVGSCRRELLDHVIALKQRHLKRLLAEYVSHHPEDHTHLGLGKGTPGCRIRSVTSGRVLSHDRLGGLHHRYDRAA